MLLANKSVGIGAAAMSAIGGVFVVLFGGWDSSLQTLIICMGVDFLTGIIVSSVFKKSTKTETGAYASSIGFKGLMKKMVMLLAVLLAVQVDILTQSGGYTRTAVILFFIANEGLSIIENMGLMGIPLPDIMKNAFDALKKKTDE